MGTGRCLLVWGGGALICQRVGGSGGVYEFRSHGRVIRRLYSPRVGTSYCGGTQHSLGLMGGAASSETTDHGAVLRCIMPVDAMCNLYRAGMGNGGAFELRWWNWIMGGAVGTMGAPYGSRQAVQDPEVKGRALEQMSEDRLSYLKHLPLRMNTTPLKLAPEYETWLCCAMRGPPPAPPAEAGYGIGARVAARSGPPILHRSKHEHDCDFWFANDILNKADL